MYPNKTGDLLVNEHHLKRIQVPAGYLQYPSKSYAAVALYYFSYNFTKIHSTLRCTPAMAAGVTDRLWDVADFVTLIEASEIKEGLAA